MTLEEAAKALLRAFDDCAGYEYVRTIEREFTALRAALAEEAPAYDHAGWLSPPPVGTSTGAPPAAPRKGEPWDQVGQLLAEALVALGTNDLERAYPKLDRAMILVNAHRAPPAGGEEVEAVLTVVDELLEEHSDPNREMADWGYDLIEHLRIAKGNLDARRAKGGA